MARTKNGALEITKTEAKNIRLMLELVSWKDLDKKTYDKVHDAVSTVAWIVSISEPLK